MEVKLKEKSKSKSYSFIVTHSDAGKRLDTVVAKHFSSISRSMAKKLIKTGNIVVNNQIKSAHYQVKEEDIINIEIPEIQRSEIIPIEMKLDVIYEDDYILVINKPPNIPVHPSAGHRNDTLVNALLGYLGKTENLSSIGGIERPGIVHRLDKDTSGVLLIAKNDHSHLKLSEQFQYRKIQKNYEAILKGILEKDRGKIESSIARHPTNRKKFTTAEHGKDSITFFEVIDRKNETTWVRFMPKTGRTHQLRVHSVSIGHPIVGDPIYSRGYTKHKYLALVAKSLKIVHPKTGLIYTFIASYPNHFIEIAKYFGYRIDVKENKNRWMIEKK